MDNTLPPSIQAIFAKNPPPKAPPSLSPSTNWYTGVQSGAYRPNGAPAPAPEPNSPEGIDAAFKKNSPLTSEVAKGAEKTAAGFVEQGDVLGTMNRIAKGDNADLNTNKIPNLMDAANPLKTMHKLAGEGGDWTGTDTTVKPSENKDFSGTSPAERAQMEQPSNYDQKVGQSGAIIAANVAPFAKEAVPVIKDAIGKPPGPDGGGGSGIRGALSTAKNATVEAAKSAAKAPLNALRGYADSKVRDSIKSDVSSLFSKSGAISRRVSEVTGRGNDIQKTFSDPAVFDGLKVEGGRINPDAAIETLNSRIDPLIDILNKKVLPLLDDQGVKITLGDVWSRAKAYIEKSPGLLGDKKGVGGTEARVRKQLEKYVEKSANEGHEADSLPISDIDQLRSDARASARDAKDINKPDSEYSALETAARDAVFDKIDELPGAQTSDFRALRNYIKQNIEAKTFADKNLRGMSVEAGRTKGTAMRLLGTLAGGTNGPLGILVGHGMGGLLADIVTNTQLGSGFKMALIKDLTSDPAMIQKAQSLLAEIEKMQPTLLPEGKGTPVSKPSGPTLYSGPGGLSENIETATHGGGPRGEYDSKGNHIPQHDIEQEIHDAFDQSVPDPYTPDNKLPVIDYGKGKRAPSKGSNLPTIR